MRMCYSIDFSAAGKLSMTGGRMAAIVRHNNRKPGTAEETQKQKATWFETDGERRRNPYAANIDGNRTAQNAVWINPKYTTGGGWTAAADLPDDAAAPIWAALGGLLGIKTGKDGRLRYGEGKGQRKTRADATAATIARRERRRKQNGGLLVKKDAVLAVDLVLQASPAVFFPKIKKEAWTQEQIDKSSYRPASRGPVDMAAVHDFQAAGLRWAADHFGAERIAEVALHMDEASPHLHIIVIPEENGRLRAASLIKGPDAARKMLDKMKPYFSDINGQALDRPIEGNPSAGKMYDGLNRKLYEENKQLTEKNARLTEENNRILAENSRLEEENKRLTIDNERLAAEATAATTARNTAAAATYASGQKAKAADERRKRQDAKAAQARQEAEQERETAARERQRAQEAADAVGLSLPNATAAAACWRAAVAACPDLEAIPAEVWKTIWQENTAAAEALRRTAQEKAANEALAQLLPSL